MPSRSAKKSGRFRTQCFAGWHSRVVALFACRLSVGLEACCWWHIVVCALPSPLNKSQNHGIQVYPHEKGGAPSTSRQSWHQPHCCRQPSCRHRRHAAIPISSTPDFYHVAFGRVPVRIVRTMRAASHRIASHRIASGLLGPNRGVRPSLGNQQAACGNPRDP